MKHLRLFVLSASVLGLASTASALGSKRGAYACQSGGERVTPVLGSYKIKFGSRYRATESLARYEAMNRCEKDPKVANGTCDIDFCLRHPRAVIDQRDFE